MDQITSVRIQNARNIVDSTFRLVEGGITFVDGEAGSGKSTVIDCIKAAANASWVKLPRSLVRAGAPWMEITLTIEGPVGGALVHRLRFNEKNLLEEEEITEGEVCKVIWRPAHKDGREKAEFICHQQGIDKDKIEDLLTVRGSLVKHMQNHHDVRVIQRLHSVLSGVWSYDPTPNLEYLTTGWSDLMKQSHLIQKDWAIHHVSWHMGRFVSLVDGQVWVNSFKTPALTISMLSRHEIAFMSLIHLIASKILIRRDQHPTLLLIDDDDDAIDDRMKQMLDQHVGNVLISRYTSGPLRVGPDKNF